MMSGPARGRRSRALVLRALLSCLALTAFADSGLLPPIKANSGAFVLNIDATDGSGEVPLADAVFSLQGVGTLSINDERTQLVYLPPAYLPANSLVEINIQGDGDSGVGVKEVYGQVTFYVQPADAIRIDLVPVP